MGKLRICWIKTSETFRLTSEIFQKKNVEMSERVKDLLEKNQIFSGIK